MGAFVYETVEDNSKPAQKPGSCRQTGRQGEGGKEGGKKESPDKCNFTGRSWKRKSAVVSVITVVTSEWVLLISLISLQLLIPLC
ncbi:hypothetical protein MHYP_G00306230 [Metynnis hypsauchen]